MSSECTVSAVLQDAVVFGHGPELRMRLNLLGSHLLICISEPLPGEVVIDKPGKGSFWNTPIMHALKARGITHLLVSGVTTECCFSTSIREANDRGFECCGITQATSGYNPAFKTASLEMIYWSQGLFGFVAELQPLLNALTPSGLPLFSKLTTPPQTPPLWDGDLSINGLRAAYRQGLSPITVAEAVYDRIDKCE